MTATSETDAASLLSQLSGDSRAAQIAQLLSAMNNETNSTEKIARQYKSTLENFRSILSEIKRENMRLREVNNGLLAHSELLAGAVGACPECWGEDPDCEFCEGDGGPGSFLPEQDSFDEFVKPVLRMVRESMLSKRRNHKIEAAKQTPASSLQNEEEPER